MGYLPREDVIKPMLKLQITRVCVIRDMENWDFPLTIYESDLLDTIIYLCDFSLLCSSLTGSATIIPQREDLQWDPIRFPAPISFPYLALLTEEFFQIHTNIYNCSEKSLLWFSIIIAANIRFLYMAYRA